MKFKKFKTYDGGRITTQRIVNQEEITEFVSKNPGKTENEIMNSLYGYDRNTSWRSNKKYADCLRRTLRSGKIFRKEVKKRNKKTFVYFVV